MPGEDDEGWHLELLPLRPSSLVHGCDRALHDVGVEARDQALVGGLEICDPGVEYSVDDGIVTEMTACRGHVRERDRP